MKFILLFFTLTLAYNNLLEPNLKAFKAALEKGDVDAMTRHSIILLRHCSNGKEELIKLIKESLTPKSHPEIKWPKGISPTL